MCQWQTGIDAVKPAVENFPGSTSDRVHVLTMLKIAERAQSLINRIKLTAKFKYICAGGLLSRRLKKSGFRTIARELKNSLNPADASKTSLYKFYTSIEVYINSIVK